MDDINMDGRYLKVMGKGGKERIVPFGGSAEKALLRYSLRFRPEPFNPSIRCFFLNPDGKPLTRNCVYLVIRRIALKSGVSRLHPLVLYPNPDGNSASVPFEKITYGEVSDEERNKVRSDLEKYCALDTEGMIWIVERLRQYTE